MEYLLNGAKDVLNYAMLHLFNSEKLYYFAILKKKNWFDGQ